MISYSEHLFVNLIVMTISVSSLAKKLTWHNILHCIYHLKSKFNCYNGYIQLYTVYFVLVVHEYYTNYYLCACMANQIATILNYK